MVFLQGAYKLRLRVWLLLVLLVLFLRAQPALVWLGLRKAILGLGMGSLLPHLMSLVSRAEQLQGPSENFL